MEKPLEGPGLADERCSRAVLDFLATTDVGKLAPAPAEEDVQSEVSEWELRQRREREEERRVEAEELGAGAGEPLIPSTRAFGGRRRGVEKGGAFICSFICYFFGASSIFTGQARAEGNGKLAMSRQRADSSGETG
jgi:hypothetical protein